MAAADLDAPRPAVPSFLVAIAAVAIATVPMLLLTFVAGPGAPFLMYFGAIIVSAWYGGFRPGLLATLLASLVSWYAFLPPAWSFAFAGTPTAVRLVIFVAEGVLVSYLCGLLHSARYRESAATVEAKKERQATLESERQYRLMVENVRDYAMFMMDREGNVRKWNTGAERLLGWQEEEIIGRPGALIFTPEDQEKGEPQKEIEEARHKGHAADERWHQRKDGSRFFASGMMMAVKDEGGNLVGFTKVLRDETERRQAIEQLRESELRVRLLLDSTAEGIYGLDRDSKCTFANAACARLLGYDSPDKLVGRDMHALIHHHHADETSYSVEECRIHKGFLHGEGVHVDNEVLWRKDGSSFPAEYWSYPAVVKDGKVEVAVVTFLDITERHRAEKELQKFKFLTDNANDSLVLFDEDARVVYANKFACERRGYPEGGMIGLTISDLDEVYSPIKFQELFARARRERVPTFETVHKAKDGSEFPAEVTATYIELDGKPYLYGASRDITQRRKAETELRESGARLHAALAIANLGTFEWNVATNAVTLDDRSREIFGFAPGEGTHAQEVFERIDPVDFERVYAEAQHSRDTLSRLETEYRINLPDGSTRTIASVNETVAGPDGKAERMFGVFSDITERKRAETALRESEEQHRAILAALEEGVILHDASGAIVMANASAERVLGLTVPQMTGRDSFDPLWRAITEDGSELSGEAHPAQVALRTRQPVTNSVMGVHRPDRTLVWLSINAIPLLDPRTGHATGVVASFFDISARRAAEEERERLLASERIAREAAETANAAKDRFLAVLSHELRNPLAPVLAAASLMLHDRRLPEDLREEVSTIHRNAQLEARLIDDLLDLSRVAKGKMHMEIQPVHVDALIAHSLTICEPEIKAKELKVTITLEATRSNVMGDPARLQQVLWNLLRNAIKFTGHGTSIRVETQNDATGALVIRVTDEGVGIAPEDLHRIFRPFEQAVSTSQFGGLGLGLTISRTLAELHQGTLRVESAGSSKGATFILTLPTLPEQIDGVAAPELPSVAAMMRVPGLRVLLVEDHPDAARTMAKILTRQGHTVYTAGTVAEALEHAAAHELDVVVSDIGLGAESGHDLMRTLRARHPGLPGIALSGYGMETDVEQSLQAGFGLHLTKPVDPVALQDALAAITKP